MPRSKVQRNETKSKYSKHDIVWAKTAGYRWWPASITCLPSKNKYFYKVDFIGDRSYALLSEEKLAPFLDLRDQYQLNKKNDKHFSNAVTIAARKYQQLVAKHGASIKSNDSVECKTSQLKQQLNEQIQLPQIPENIQQISSLNQYQLLSPQQNPSLKNLNNIPTQSLDEIHSPEKPTERSPTQLLKPSDSIDSEPLCLQPENRQKLMQQLLTKYKLNSIPDLKQQRKVQKENSLSEKKKTHWKRKFITKGKHSLNEQREENFGEEQLLARKIYKILLRKLHGSQQCRVISLSLKDQIMGEKIEKANCLKKVIEWIWTTQSQNIVSYHSQWINFYKDSERQREKHSNLTMEDESESISMIK